MRTSAIDPNLVPNRLVREVRGSLKGPVGIRPSLDQKLDEFRKLQSGMCVAINGMWERLDNS